MDIDFQTILIWLAIGLAAGWIASRLVGGNGIVRYIIAGLLGSVVGGFLVQAFGLAIPIDNEWIRQILISTAGAIIVILMSRLIA